MDKTIGIFYLFKAIQIVELLQIIRIGRCGQAIAQQKKNNDMQLCVHLRAKNQMTFRDVPAIFDHNLVFREIFGGASQASDSKGRTIINLLIILRPERS